MLVSIFLIVTKFFPIEIFIQHLENLVYTIFKFQIIIKFDRIKIRAKTMFEF